MWTAPKCLSFLGSEYIDEIAKNEFDPFSTVEHEVSAYERAVLLFVHRLLDRHISSRCFIVLRSAQSVLFNRSRRVSET